jgi:hypothetical protein
VHHLTAAHIEVDELMTVKTFGFDSRRLLFICTGSGLSHTHGKSNAMIDLKQQTNFDFETKR